MRKLRCLTCPLSCWLTVSISEEGVNVRGNECYRGFDFAVKEINNPTRSLTTTVRTSFPGVPVLPVRTDGEIPKDKIMEAMRTLRSVVISTELDCGDTVLEDFVGTGVRVIATSDILLAFQ